MRTSESKGVLRTILQISLLTGRPQDLPASYRLLGLAALCSFALNYIVDQAHPDAFVRVRFALLETVLLGATVWAALAIRRYPNRWLQTMTALYAASALVNFFTLPVTGWLLYSHGPAPVLAALALTAWFIAIMTNVLHHALSTSIALSALITIGLLMAAGFVLLALFPLPRT